MSDEKLLTRELLAIVILLFVGSLAYALYGIAQVPADALVPTHWNAAGEPDDWGSRWSMLLGPGIQLFMLGLIPLVARVEPRRQHMRMSYGPLRTVLIAMSVLFAGVSVMIVRSSLGEEVDIGRWMIIGMGLLFLVLGNMLGKIRSTFTFGVRTPWTLSSEKSWVATHRLTGRLWTGIGFVVLVLGLFGFVGEVMLYVFLGGILGSVVVVTVYSYFVWKADPDRKESP